MKFYRDATSALSCSTHLYVVKRKIMGCLLVCGIRSLRDHTIKQLRNICEYSGGGGGIENKTCCLQRKMADGSLVEKIDAGYSI